MIQGSNSAKTLAGQAGAQLEPFRRKKMLFQANGPAGKVEQTF